MKKHATLFLLFGSLAASPVLGQKAFEEARPKDSYAQTDGVAYKGIAYVSDRNSNKLYSYDGSSLRRVTYPAKRGATLKYGSNMLVYNNNIYFILTSDFMDNYFYRYDGSHFTEIPVAESPVALITHKGKLYLLAEISLRYLGLYSYDGTAVTNTGYIIPEYDLGQTSNLSGKDLAALQSRINKEKVIKTIEIASSSTAAGAGQQKLKAKRQIGRKKYTPNR